MNGNDAWKRRAYLTGAAIGLCVGLLAAFLYVRSADEKGDGAPRINTMEALRLGAALIGLLRQIATLSK